MLIQDSRNRRRKEGCFTSHGLWSYWINSGGITLLNRDTSWKTSPGGKCGAGGVGRSWRWQTVCSFSFELDGENRVEKDNQQSAWGGLRKRTRQAPPWLACCSNNRSQHIGEGKNSQLNLSCTSTSKPSLSQHSYVHKIGWLQGPPWQFLVFPYFEPWWRSRL